MMSGKTRARRRAARAEAADEIGVADRDHRLENDEQDPRRRKPQQRGEDRGAEEALGGGAAQRSRDFTKSSLPAVTL